MDKWALWFPVPRTESLRNEGISILDGVLRVLQMLESDHFFFCPLPLGITISAAWLGHGPHVTRFQSPSLREIPEDTESWEDKVQPKAASNPPNNTSHLATDSLSSSHPQPLENSQ